MATEVLSISSRVKKGNLIHRKFIGVVNLTPLMVSGAWTLWFIHFDQQDSNSSNCKLLHQDYDSCIILLWVVLDSVWVQLTWDTMSCCINIALSRCGQYSPRAKWQISVRNSNSWCCYNDSTMTRFQWTQTWPNNYLLHKVPGDPPSFKDGFPRMIYLQSVLLSDLTCFL